MTALTSLASAAGRTVALCFDYDGQKNVFTKTRSPYFTSTITASVDLVYNMTFNTLEKFGGSINQGFAAAATVALHNRVSENVPPATYLGGILLSYALFMGPVFHHVAPAQKVAQFTKNNFVSFLPKLIASMTAVELAGHIVKGTPLNDATPAASLTFAAASAAIYAINHFVSSNATQPVQIARTITVEDTIQNLIDQLPETSSNEGDFSKDSNPIEKTPVETAEIDENDLNELFDSFETLKDDLPLKPQQHLFPSTSSAAPAA